MRLKQLCEQLVAELREWNPDSEAANEVEEHIGSIGVVEEVEDLIDRYGITTLIDAVVEVCFLKEEHVRTNWQDHALGDAWQRTALTLKKACERISFFEIPQADGRRCIA